MIGFNKVSKQIAWRIISIEFINGKKSLEPFENGDKILNIEKLFVANVVLFIKPTTPNEAC